MRQPVDRGGNGRVPKVMIIIATDVIGGPGNGIFQFLKYEKSKEFSYVLCNYSVSGKEDENSEFIRKAREEGNEVRLLHQRMVIDPLLILEARRLLIKEGVDIVQTHGYKSNILGFCLKMICRIPWIGFAHGYTADNKRMLVYNKMDVFALRFANKVVAVSEAMKQFLVARGVNESKISVIHNAVDKDELESTKGNDEIKSELKISNDEKVIGVVGRLGPEKGQIVFLKALKLVMEKLPSLKAIIVGDGQDRNTLETYCARNGLQKNVIFTGYQKDVPNYYQVMDLLVIPSYSEGLPNVLLEAMVLGIPVIATAVGGIPEVLGNNDAGILVSSGDVKMLAEKMISSLSDNRDRLNRWQFEDRKTTLLKFDSRVRANNIIDLYYQVLSG